MVSDPKIYRVAVYLAGGLALAAGALAQSKPVGKAASKTETGYVVSLSDAAMTISNIPVGSGGGAPSGGGPQFVTRTVEGGTQGEGGAAGKAPGKIVMSGGPGTHQIQLGPGDVVRGADGKLSLSEEAKKRFSPDQQKTIEEMLKDAPPPGQGGQQIIRRGPEGAEGGGWQQAPAAGKAPISNVPLQLTDFTFDKKTKRPASLSKGDKVKITYTEVDGKKLATRIEAAK